MELSSNLLSLVQPHLGVDLETRGRNDGPVIDKIRLATSRHFADHSKGIPWCGMTVFWVFRELTGMDRAALTRALGYDPSFCPEACDSWYHQARFCPRPDGARLVASPSPYDIFLWHRRRPNGTYDPLDIIHMGIVMPPALVRHGLRYSTFEGNTCPEHQGDGQASREGNCMAFRSRLYNLGGTSFVHTPDVIKECF